MRNLFYFLVLFPLFAFARNGDVILSSEGQETLPLLEDVREAMAKKNIPLKLCHLKDVKKWDKVAYTVIWNKPHIKNRLLNSIPKKRAILFQWESPVESPKLYSRKYTRHFRKVYTWNDDLVDNYRFFKFYFPALKPMEEGIPSFEKKKLLTMVARYKKASKKEGALYPERIAAAECFDGKNFDLYGAGWDKSKYRSHREGTPDLKNYRFAVCYEDVGGVKGYITEKIFNTFAAGCVPIYLGATNITDYIPKECFIDRRDFATDEDLYAFIESMDKATYEKYLASIRSFLGSEKAQLFSKKYFEIVFLEAIRFP
ncbi:MAG: hypothetical protein JSR58_08225 [Verrucomicrobia bacterium]|nr:hypothetical protein [Verrucomicrobiota bacterium]